MNKSDNPTTARVSEIRIIQKFTDSIPIFPDLFLTLLTNFYFPDFFLTLLTLLTSNNPERVSRCPAALASQWEPGLSLTVERGGCIKCLCNYGIYYTLHTIYCSSEKAPS